MGDNVAIPDPDGTDTYSPDEYESYVEQKDWVYDSDTVECIEDDILRTDKKVILRIRHEVITPEQIDGIRQDSEVNILIIDLDAGHISVGLDADAPNTKTTTTTIQGRLDDYTITCDTHGELADDEISVSTDGVLLCSFCSTTSHVQNPNELNDGIDPSVTVESDPTE